MGAAAPALTRGGRAFEAGGLLVEGGRVRGAEALDAGAVGAIGGLAGARGGAVDLLGTAEACDTGAALGADVAGGTLDDAVAGPLLIGTAAPTTAAADPDASSRTLARLISSSLSR